MPAQTVSRQRYDALTQSLHWLIAVAVAAAYAIALVRDELPKGDLRTALLSLHMSVGLLVMALSVARIGWRLSSRAPDPLPMPAPMAIAAKGAHLLLYLAMFAIPLIGLFAAWYKGRTVGFFAVLPLPSPVGIDKGIAELLEEAHEVAAHLMMLTAGLHAAAAIVHQYVMKDGTLGRMLPFVSAAPAAPAE